MALLYILEIQTYFHMCASVLIELLFSTVCRFMVELIQKNTTRERSFECKRRGVNVVTVHNVHRCQDVWVQV